MTEENQTAGVYSCKTEEAVKKYWTENGVPEKVRTKNADKYYYFIDGPPYASGHIHLGTAMNRVLKDIIIRYRRMNGYNVLDIPGFDTHGVPIEIKVQKKHNLRSKEDIEKFGINNFLKECRQFATEHIADMSKDIEDLGQWMDWKHPYRTLDNSYIESAWWTFKKAVDKGLLYHGKYPVHVCPTCETSVSFNEIEHQDLKDTSVYVTMRLIEDKDTYFVIWTTTPWTLPSNLAIMVHPDYEYVELLNDGKKYIVAKELSQKLIEEFGWSNCSFGKTYKGKDLEGKKYEPLLSEWLNVPKGLLDSCYKIVLSARFVNLEDGTGLVHCAPGHGREDYQVGKENNLPIFCPVTIEGTYDDSILVHKGKKVKQLDHEIIDYLDSKGVLLAKKSLTHSYPICWRCLSPLLQVSLPQWFLKIESMKERLKEINNNEVSWYPSWAKERFDNWLDSISDWPISRSRYWGTPVPIWKCDKCDSIKVIGSMKELQELSPEIKLDDYHKPFIDNVHFTCKCGGRYSRISDVFDVWFDSGVASWASLKYPQDKKLFDKYWPPDVNIEGSDQIRGWWNSQLICSAICFDRAPFKFVALHGMVLDIQKKKLSKSLGNDKPLEEWFSLYSRDFIRYYFARDYQGMDLVMDEKRFKDVKRFFNLLENLFNFLSLSDDNLEFTLNLGHVNNLSTEDKWLLSRFSTLLLDTHTNYEACEFARVMQDLEKFVLEDLSRVYVKLSRKKESNAVLSYVISSILLLLSPVAPHFTEHMYLRFKKRPSESIHLLEMPSASKELINKALDERFSLAMTVVQTVLALREEISKRLRWVLPKLVVQLKEVDKLEGMEEIISGMANIKSVVYQSSPAKGNFASKEVNSDVVVHLDLDISSELKEEWEVSELTRMLQAERKKLNFNPSQVKEIKIACDSKEFLDKNKDRIESATNTKLILHSMDDLKGTRSKLVEREVIFSF